MKFRSISQNEAGLQDRLPLLRRPMLLDETGNWEVDQNEREKWLSRIVKGESCWTTTMGNPTKWGHVSWWPKVNGKRRTICAHRFVYFLLRGPIESRMLVLHNCPGGDNPSCVNPDHMYIGTDAHNVHDCENKGRGVHPKGEKHGRCETSEYVIRNMLVDVMLHGGKPSMAMRRWGVTMNIMSKVFQGLNWCHIGAEFGIRKKCQSIYRTKVTLNQPEHAR